MSLAYTRYHEPDTDLFFPAVAPDHRIVLYDLLMEIGSEPLEDRVKALSMEHRDSDAIILRSSRGPTIAELAPLASALSAQPVWCLVRTDDPFLAQPLNDAARAMPLPIDLDAVRDAELRALLTLAKVIHREEPPHHFVLPSRLHTDTFIDVGRLLQSYTTVHRIADWLEDRLRTPTVLLGDNGTLLPLLLELQARARQQRESHVLPVYVFERYPDTILDVRSMIRTIQTRHDLVAGSATRHQLLFLMSVSSTGRLATWVRAAEESADVLGICNTADRSLTVPIEALVHIEVQHARHENETECEARRTGIDPRTLERVYEAEWEPVIVNRKIAKDNASFWSAVDRTSAIELHADKPYWADPGGVRHHPVYLDIPALLTDGAFRQECMTKLQGITPKPDVLLLPTHDAAHEAIRALVVEALGDLTTITAHGTRLDADAPAVLQHATSILIVDDATVTGRTLSGLRRAVYAHIQPRTEEDVSVFGFVVVQRPPNSQLRKNANNGFPDKHLISGAQVYLPRPTRTQCPWCREQLLLTLFLQDLAPSVRAYADDRLAMLAAGPLRVAPIALGTQDVPPSAVTKDSDFGQLRHVAAAGAVSSVIIAMHQKDLKDQGRRFKVFQASSGLAFYDAILTGMIFRTLRPRDLHWSGETADVAEALRHGLDIQSQLPGYFAEVGFAAFEGKLPRAPVEAIYQQLTGENETPPDPAVAVIAELFRLQPEPPLN